MEVAVLLERTFQNHELSVFIADTSVFGFDPYPGSWAPGSAMSLFPRRMWSVPGPAFCGVGPRSASQAVQCLASSQSSAIRPGGLDVEAA